MHAERPGEPDPVQFGRLEAAFPAGHGDRVNTDTGREFLLRDVQLLHADRPDECRGAHWWLDNKRHLHYCQV